MLCKSCDTERHRMWLESKQKKEKDVADRTDTSAVSAQAADVVQQQTAKRRAAIKNQGKKETGSRQLTRSTADNETPGKTADPVTTDDSKPSVVINELLMYAVYYRDRSAASSLRSVILNYYSGTEISTGKKQLISLFGQCLCDSNLSTERRSSTQRSATDAEIDDILELLEIVDNLNVLVVQFVAAKYDRLPGYGPEEISVCSLID